MHLHPFRGGRNNIAYANADGVCPEDYPVPLPHLSFNLAYYIGAVTDLTDAQLSMDPTLDQHGNVESLNWGSLSRPMPTSSMAGPKTRCATWSSTQESRPFLRTAP